MRSRLEEMRKLEVPRLIYRFVKEKEKVVRERTDDLKPHIFVVECRHMRRRSPDVDGAVFPDKKKKNRFISLKMKQKRVKKKLGKNKKRPNECSSYEESATKSGRLEKFSFEPRKLGKTR